MIGADRHTAWLIFLCGLSLTLFVRGLDAETTDEILPLYAAVSLLDHGDVDIPVRDVYHPDFYVRTTDDKYYPKFGPGQALALAPFAALGEIWGRPDESGAGRGRKTLLVALFFGSVVVPLMGVLAFFAWRRMGFDASVSALSSITLIAATQLLPYSRSLFGDLTCAALALGAFCALAGPLTVGRVALAGASLGFSVLVRPVTVLFLPPFLLYLALRWRRTGSDAPSCRRQLVAALAAFGFSAAALLWFNAHAFGSPFSTGYRSEMFAFDRPLWSGLVNNFFSWEKGLFVFSPVLILSVLFWPAFHRAHRDESILALIFFALYAYVYGNWYASRPGFDLSYGQRFLLPALSFAALALPEAFARMRRPAIRIALYAVMAFSFLAQLAGCLQQGLNYRGWSAQYERDVPTYVGYALMSLDQPLTVTLWWRPLGLPGFTVAVALFVLAIIFGIRATRR